MASITEAQKAAIKKLTRRANARIGSATGGRRSYLEHQVFRATGKERFSAATKGLTFEEAALKLKNLERFFEARSATKAGWDEMVAENVAKANKTLQSRGYNLTDEELAEILEQIEEGKDKRKNYYRAINLVSARKAKMGDSWDASSEEISAAIAEKATYQQAYKRALYYRNKQK